MKVLLVVASCMLGCIAGSASAQAPRLKPLPESEWSDAQRKAARELATGPRGRLNLNGPNFALLRSPELMERTQKVGEYLRYSTSIPPRLNEFAILVTARQWNAQMEWLAHRDLAIKAGLSPAVADDLASGKRPAAMNADEAAVYQFCKEIHDNKGVTDATYKAVFDRFGERGVIDLVGVTGYYTMLAMVLNVTQIPLPAGTAAPLAPVQ